MNSFIIEIATADFHTTEAAVEGGADRVELCADLGQGGTTPSYATIKKCREAFSIDLFPIIRPRGGDFLYTDAEYSIMMDEVKLCRQLGCEGVVLGLLQKDGRIDMIRTSALIDAAYPMEVTFHRAFDRCLDPFEALEQLVAIGCQRILTSGQKPSAPAGAEMIAELVRKADGRISIMPGSGVRKENISELAQVTGATEFHSSLRGKTRSKMDYVHPAFAASEESFSHPAIEPSEVKALRKALQASTIQP